MNMIEKVAQAIREANDAMGGLSSKGDYEIAARAAIEAMRSELDVFLQWDEEGVKEWIDAALEGK
jgi:hypothetical protein